MCVYSSFVYNSCIGEPSTCWTSVELLAISTDMFVYSSCMHKSCMDELSLFCTSIGFVDSQFQMFANMEAYLAKLATPSNGELIALALI